MMAFLDNLANKGASSVYEAGLAGAVACLTLDGDMIDVERRVISLFRDQFTPLSTLDDDTFNKTLDSAVALVKEKNVGADIPGFVRAVLATSITLPADRLAEYRYLYALAMVDLNLSEGESALLKQMQTVFGLDPATCAQTEKEVLEEFKTLHRALAATVLGLIVVTVDGAVSEREIAHVKEQRNLLEPIGKLDDVQFGLGFDLSLNIHDRFLLDQQNRSAFLSNILAQMLTTPEVRRQAFAYAVCVATSDENISQAEIEILKELLQTMQINDAEGEAVFNQYMARVKTIDGKPR